MVGDGSICHFRRHFMTLVTKHETPLVFQQVSEAYEVLSDSAKRQQYDRFGTSSDQQSQNQHQQQARYSRPGARTQWSYQVRLSKLSKNFLRYSELLLLYRNLDKEGDFVL